MQWALVGFSPLAMAVVGAASCIGSEPTVSGAAGGGGGSTCPFTVCGTACTDTQLDPANCGACGKACEAGQVCTEGACATTCPTAQTLCGSACADTAVDPANCGTCGHACDPGVVCKAGTCSPSCPAAQSLCGSACADTSVDPANCGTCGHACTAGEVCATGTCSTSCPATQPLCGTTCTNVAVDPANCGTCGHACGAGQICANSTCTTACPAAQSLCGSACADTAVDPANCGTCGHACNPGDLCSASTCGLACESGRMLCSDPGAGDAGATQLCVDPTSDSRNCGACGTACAPGEYCSASACAYPTSCGNVLTHTGPATDGAYVIQPAGLKPYTVWCAGMGTATPKEYLTLLHTYGNGATLQNFSSYEKDNNSCKCTDNAYRYFEKVRINPATLVIDVTDVTFSTNVSNDPNCWAAFTSGICTNGDKLLYAFAGNCILNGGPASANINVQGLPFSIDPSVTFVPVGSSPYGTSTFSPDRTKVDFTGGGYCGDSAPPGPLLLKQN